MKKYIVQFLLLSTLLLSNHLANGQCGATSGTGTFDPIENNFCGGEKEVWVGKRFSTVDVPLGKEVWVQVNWGYPGAIEYFPSFFDGSNYNINSGNTVTPTGIPVFADNRYAYHVYPDELGECEFEVDVSIVFVNIGQDPATHPSAEICTSSTNTLPTTYWDTDAFNTGALAIENGPIIRICEGESVTIDPLANISDYNCPLTNNTSDRWFQWIYNVDTGNPIPDVEIVGANINEIFNVGGIPSNLDFEEVVQLDPGPNLVTADIDMDPTGAITIDGTNTVAGQYFDIRLNAWNICNPFDDEDIPGTPSFINALAADFDPEFITIRILIVSDPDLNPISITDAGGTPKPGNKFCPEESIQISNGGSNLGPGPWTISIYDGPTTAAPLIVSYNNQNRLIDTENTDGSTVANNLNSPGIKTVEVTKVNNDISISLGCSSTITAQYEIISTPLATIGFDDGTFGVPNTTDNSYEICTSDLPLQIDLTDESAGKTVNLTTTWIVERIFPNPTVLTNVDDGGGSALPFDYPTNPLVISDSGHYRVRLIIDDASTNCNSSDQFDIFVYDAPESSFTATGVCEGEDTDFNPSASNIPTVINGDAIANYIWDFSFDGITFNNELTRTNNATFSQNLGAAGTYSVALIVETAKSCLSDTFLLNVEVYPNPDADLQAFYGSEFDGNLVDDPYTGDPICPGTLIKFENTSDEASNDPSILDVSYVLEIDSLGTTIFRNIGASGSFAIPDIFYNTNTVTNVQYTIKLIALANPTDANPDNNCRIESSIITVDVLPGSPSGFTIEDEAGLAYDPANSYCSPHEFLFQINGVTNSLLAAGDSLVWEVFDGSTLLGGDTVLFTDPDYRDFRFEFNNDYPSIAPINYTINLRPFVAGVCVNPSQNTVRVLPKPDSTFLPLDTVYSCDFVTYTFEATQPGLLAYNWDPQPAAEVSSSSIVGNEYEVVFNRPGITDPALNVSVQLQTVNPFGCISGISDPFEDIIQPKDDFTINLVPTGTETCIPAAYNFDNQTNLLDVPADTEWELHILNTGLGTTEIIKGSDLSGNEDFTNGYDYEFTLAGTYEVRLKALLTSNCDLSSDPPVILNINNTPQMRFSVINQAGCTPVEIQLIDNSTNFDTDPLLNNQLQSVNLTVLNITTGISRPPINITGSPTIDADFWNGQTLVDFEFDAPNTPGGINFNDYVVSIQGTNTSGCSDIARDTVRVFREPLIEFDVLQPNPACEENYEFEFDITTFSVPGGTTLTWNWGDGTQTIDPSSTNKKHSYPNRASFFGPDQYVVTLTAQTPNGCITSVKDTVKLNPRVQGNFFADKNVGCSPLNVNFTSSSLGTSLLNNHVYKKRVKGTTAWTTFTNTPSNIGMVSETFANTTSSNLIYEILYVVSSDVGGCSDTADIKEIEIYPEFDSPPITGSNIVCAFEQSVSYSVPLTSGSNYLWQLPLGAFISNQNIEGNEVEINFSNFNGNISVTEINANGCFGNPSILPINVLTGPSASLELTGPNVICPGGSTTLKFNITGPGSSGFDVVYNNGSTNDTLRNIQDGHNIQVSPSNSTNYFLLDVTDLEYPACFPNAITGSAFVSVNIQPSVTLTGNATICEGSSTNLFFNLTGIGPWEVKYTDGTSQFSFSTTSPVHLESVSPTEDVTYSVISVTDNNTPICSGTVNGTAEINVNQKATAEIFGDQNNICANATTALKLNLTGVSPWIVRFTDGTNIFTLNNITPPASYNPLTDVFTYTFDVSPPAGTTSYQLVDVRDANIPSCLGDISGSAVIEAFERPTVTLEGNATICTGQSTPIKFNTTGDGPFTIRYLANSDTVEINNINAGASINVSPQLSTVYRIVDIMDVRGCISNIPSGPISVNVNQLPTAVLSGADTICFGEQVNLVFDLTGVGPWQINYTDGVQNYNFTTSFNRHFEPITPTATRTYNILSITDSNNPNCSNTGSGSPQIFVYPDLDASFTVTPENMELPKSDVDIVNTTTNKNSWEYTWDFGDGNTSTEVDPGNHEYETYGQYLIKMTATNGQCTDSFQQLVTIGAIPPIVDFVANPVEGCLPLVVEFENLTKFADPGTYQWEFGDNQRARAVENPTHVYTSPGVYTVRLIANNITGQEREVIKEDYITVYETPQASFTIPDEFRQVFTGEEVQFVNTSIGADEFVWKLGDGNQSFDENPVHVYPDSGVYDITLIAINSITGCQDSFKLDAQVKVVLGGDSKIANAFTPSRAGPGSASSNVQSNDVFLPQLKGVSQFNMKVYNRWGELLFETNDKNIGWDGYYKGTLMPQGVYVYRLELVFDNGRRETKVGDITLIR